MSSWIFTQMYRRFKRGVAYGHVIQTRNYGTPYNFWMNWPICFKFGTEMEDWFFLRTNHKMTANWAWLESRDQFRNSGTPV